MNLRVGDKIIYLGERNSLDSPHPRFKIGATLVVIDEPESNGNVFCSDSEGHQAFFDLKGRIWEKVISIDFSAEELIYVSALVGNISFTPTECNNLFDKLLKVVETFPNFRGTETLRLKPYVEIFSFEPHKETYKNMLQKLLPEKYPDPRKKKLDELESKRVKLDLEIEQLKKEIENKF